MSGKAQNTFVSREKVDNECSLLAIFVLGDRLVITLCTLETAQEGAAKAPEQQVGQTYTGYIVAREDNSMS